MLSHMFPYLSCLSMIFTRILGNSPEQPPIRIITLFPCKGLVNPEHDPWKSRPKTVKRDWFVVTWEDSGKAVKAHRRVLCRDGPCFAHVLKPSKWSMATWPGAGKGLPLQGNVFAVTWEGSGKAVKAHRGVLCRDGPCFAHVLKPSKWSMATGQALAKAAAAGQRVRSDLGRQWQSGKGPQRGFVSWWAVLRARFETL